MNTHKGQGGQALLVTLCCLVPLSALGATLFLNTPILPTVLVALVVLVPLAERLLTIL